MSLSVAGVWAVGVWDQTVWADGVWREGAYVSSVRRRRTGPGLTFGMMGKMGA